ncbi:MAG: pyridoxal phosphate-dependent aminotransferase [Candidatus Scalindua sp.]|jgi:aspartate aminotransferase|nr:pyridoxal phosphate-dependent aminotransferase [Candidatus Scalindua sp.]
MKHLSLAANNVQGQPMFKILDQVQKIERTGREILHFELGEPDFDTPSNIINSACDSLKSGNTHYTNSMGLYELRETVQSATKESRGFTPEISQILVTPGANSIIYLAVSCLVNPGEEVIIPDPGFPTYHSVISYCGAIPVTVPLHEANQFRLNPEDVRKKITEKTRLIIINSPSNPTGAVMSPGEINEIGKIAIEHDIYLLSDEIYARLVFDGENKFHSPAWLDQCKERIIIINGFSKAFAMTGWRLGVAIGPAEVIEKMGLVVQTIISCVPPFIQYAGIEAINGDQTELINMKDQYQQRRNVIVAGLNKIDGIKCINPDGAMYVFPNIRSTGMSSDEFANFVLQKAGVALLPGNNFGRFGEGYIRMCYVNSMDKITEALEKINNALLEYNR